MTNTGEAHVSPTDFARLREILYGVTGIVFEDAKYEYLRRRVQQRIAATHTRDFRSYLSLLQGPSRDAELQSFVNLVTVNETYFFREEYQLRCIARSMLDEVIARDPARRTIRLWCMPCSTGEEPYSLAIYLLEHWPLADSFGIEIVGSDIDTAVLKHASVGRYGRHALRNLPPPLLAKYFSRDGDEHVICDPLRESIDFTHVNLNAASVPPGHGDFDVVLCRNLLIYFDEVSRRRAVETLYESLRPGGFLCLGHSESMSRISNLFIARKFPDALVYQRPFDGSP